MGGYGTFAYLMSEREEEPALARELLAGLLQRADGLTAVSDPGRLWDLAAAGSIYLGQQYGGIESCDAPAGGGKTVWL